jgi:hypothetical protein
MMEGPLLEGKFWTEPSIVDTDENEGEGEVDGGPKSGSGSDSHVPRQTLVALTVTESTLLLLVFPLPPAFHHISILLLARPEHSS